MQLLQSAKASMPILHKTRATKLFLVFTTLLLCLVFVPLLGGARTAYAASVTPAATGGGCGSDGAIQACISENSTGYIVTEAYILQSNICGVRIILEKNSTIVVEEIFGQCYSAGTHLSGPTVLATAGQTYQAVVAANGNHFVSSPPLYT
jgi:hypothetical protein